MEIDTAFKKKIFANPWLDSEKKINNKILMKHIISKITRFHQKLQDGRM